MRPKVSFVIPCYKLAHFLGDCIQSILDQTYRDFEILVMDDCSPDETPQVAQSFSDPRVRHIRNPQNLGHLRNYNRGLEVAQGDYLWLISADDRLRSPLVLERYLGVLENDSKIGFACCPGMELENGKETRVSGYSVLSDTDQVFKGGSFLAKLLDCNCVIAASGLVRRQCYAKVGMFPLDMPYAGDWLLWCLFALHFDVAYFSEPMVNYRQHQQSMASVLVEGQIRECIREGLATIWRLKQEAASLGMNRLVADCNRALARQYGEALSGSRFRQSHYRMEANEFEESLNRFHCDRSDAAWLHSYSFSSAGDQCYRAGDYAIAQHHYQTSLRRKPFRARVWLKYGLMSTGSAGLKFREQISSWRQFAKGDPS